MKEDNDSGHSSGKDEIAEVEENGLNYYLNAPGSLDLASIENHWQPPKDALDKIEIWDEELTNEGAMKACINDFKDGRDVAVSWWSRLLSGANVFLYRVAPYVKGAGMEQER